MKQVLTLIGLILSVGIFSIIGYAENTVVVGSPASGTNDQAEIDIKSITIDNFNTNFTNVSSNYTMVERDYSIFCNATSGDVTITLLPSADVSGRVNVFTKTDSTSNSCIVNGNSSEEVSGLTTFDLNAIYESITIQSNGTEWYIY